MPQMSPINWVSMFISITTIFIAINSINYFMLENKKEKSTTNKKCTKVNNWKW
uniref:ATP synthase complex subunit 8 n=1 Tax=Tetraphalerus bruchi TaxID=546504 RepID=B6D8Y6_TETBR|nr:ATP synthase F0 subunit 8 [Tetraphalerus bruchi]ACF35124.1 ATP synthase F0 subunit 8 [Tetraphalerus bruchi]